MKLEKEITISISDYNYFIKAVETLQIISELDPVKNNSEDYRDAVCAILEAKGWL